MYLTIGLHRALQHCPDRTATVFGERRRTYRELADRVARLATVLRDAGMQPGDRVGMLAQNSDRYIECLMAVWWGGGVMNPVNTRWSVPEIVYSLDDSDTSILLVDDAFVPLADKIAASARRNPVWIYAGEKTAPEGMLDYEGLLAQATPSEDAMRDGTDLAVILYTGGTTGFPKGVMQGHGNLLSGFLQRLTDGPRLPNSVILHSAPLFHLAGMARAVQQVLMCDTQVITPAFDAGEALAAVEAERITELTLVPTMIQALIDHPDFDKYDLSSLKRLIYMGSPIQEGTLERLMRQLPQVALTHAYGLTETCGSVTINPPENYHGEALALGRHRSCGRASTGVHIKVVDSEGREVPRGTVGEIVIRSASVMQGYWNKPEQTAEALRDGWLHTGDGARMDDAGYLYIVDRIKDMIVSGGENVYSAEVENVLSRHPAVLSCAVIGIPHPKWGEAVHAVVVCRTDSPVSGKELQDYCRESLAGYKCPKSIEFREALPVSAAGKVLKRDLRQVHWEGKTSAVN